MNLEDPSLEPATPANSAPQLSLYMFPSCPYCKRVLREMEQRGLKIELRNIHQDRKLLVELIKGGGKKTVPCLRMDYADGTTEWMYESLDIIDYLKALGES